MGTIFRYLFAVLLNLAWQRLGNRTAAPPVRLPKKVKPLPVIGPWQVMLLGWIANKLWERYQTPVRKTAADKFRQVQHPAAHRIGNLIHPPGPDDPDAAMGNGPVNVTAHAVVSTPADTTT